MYYFTHLALLKEEMEVKKAQGFQTPEILPRYLKEILKDYWTSDMTAEHRNIIRELRRDLIEKFGR